MELKKELGRNIKKFRKLQNLTQENLAEAVGLEVISISSIETGRYFPSPDNLVKISQALNVSISQLFNFKEDYTCEGYIEEISKNINLIKNDKTKLSAINSFIINIV